MHPVKCIQESASTVTMFSITDMSYSLIKKNTEMPVYLFISIGVDELYESLCKFLFIQPLLRKTSHYCKEYLCVICRTMNVGPFVSYSQRLQSKVRWLHTTYKSKEHIHHG